MIHLNTLGVILLMMLITYATRLAGFLLLRRAQLSPRAMQLLEIVPACVLISVIAPHFMTRNPADLASLALVCVMAMRFSMLPTVLVAVGSSVLFKHVF